MKLALAVLCVVGVAFLLRVLVAFVRDARHSSPLKKTFYYAKFVPSRSTELVVLEPQFYRRPPTKTDERIAS